MDTTGKLSSTPENVKGKAELGRGSALGRYTVLEKLGEGGMGVVYAAYDSELDRKVAIKVLSHAAQDSDDRARLLSEAQAMAKLAHPNVVAIHDVLSTEQGVVMVMEFVDGRTLKHWMKEGEHSPQEVLRHFLPAGEGLEAAHAAGLIHRDFKPDNVLVGKDGRIRVADFGIALTTAPEPSRFGDPLATPSSGSPLMTSGPSAGVAPRLAGTPGYMAPEQFQGLLGDERTDQYSFAVTLYEALAGTRPFASATISRQITNALEGRFAQGKRPIPAWLAKILRRALAPDPDERFPSMSALLTELRRDPAVLRRRLAVGAALLVPLVAFFAHAQHRAIAERRACEASPARLAGVWDLPTKERIHQAFLATGRPFAADAWRFVQRALDERTKAWADMKAEACIATRVAHEQPPSILQVRDQCLDQRLHEFTAMSELLVHADAKVVERVQQMTEGLSYLKPCSDVPALLAHPQVPTEPALRTSVDAAEQALLAINLLSFAGKYKDASERLDKVEKDVQALSYGPTLARVRDARCALSSRGSDFSAAERACKAAFDTALAVADDSLATHAANRIGYLATETNHLAEAHDWIGYSLSFLKRLGGDPVLEALTLTTEGLAEEWKLPTLQKAIDLNTRARELALRAVGPLHTTTMGIRHNYAAALSAAGRYEEAAQEAEAVLADARKLLGPLHPFLAYPEEALGECYLAQGRLLDSKRSLKDLLSLDAQSSIHPGLLAETHQTLGQIAMLEGDIPAALTETGAAAAILGQALAPDDPKLLMAQGERIRALAAAGNLAEARSLAAGAVKLSEHPAAQTVPDFIAVFDGLAELHAKEGRRDDAVAAAEKALSLRVQFQGKAHPRTAWARVSLANLLLGKDSHRALELARAGLRGMEGVLAPEAPQRGMALLTLARAEKEAGEQAPSREHAQLAAAILAKSVPRRQDLQRQARALRG